MKAITKCRIGNMKIYINYQSTIDECFLVVRVFLMILNSWTIYSRKSAAAHARSDAFAKLRELYRRVMGGCLRGGGAYKLLRKQKRKKRAKKTG